MATPTAAAKNWWWIVPPAEANTQPVAADALLYSTVPGDANDKTLTAGGNITVNGKTLTRAQGPFTSEAEARKSGPGSSDPGLAADALAVAGINLNPFKDVAAALKAFFDAITNWRMWASLGWIILGLALLIIGTTLLVKGEITRSVIPGVA